MFKFNFNKTDEDEEKQEDIKEQDPPIVLEESKSIEITANHYEEIAKSLPDRSFQVFSSNDMEIGYVDNININEMNNSDLISGVYEGGYKIWECTQDLVDYFTENSESIDFAGKAVCDLGCSAGIAGLLALIKDAKAVHFQDYNLEVLESFTIPNVILYCEENEKSENFSRCSFYSGDWDSFRELTSNDEKYDIILTSETIYNPSYYQKLLNFFKNRLKDDGQIFVAAKSHYFGVGGNVLDFCELLKKDGTFQSEVVWKSSIGLQREILLLKR
ncbi:unnamed protein product [Chironomus riparius]|uniref:protein-histidine N-methyltransferase n=1 Tax=Chironomus riparius TaxID=315576 RepID=A0A9N9S2B4_9DIPT|nr:unnamed protein product [Chironomus riparius]